MKANSRGLGTIPVSTCAVVQVTAIVAIGIFIAGPNRGLAEENKSRRDKGTFFGLETGGSGDAGGSDKGKVADLNARLNEVVALVGKGEYRAAKEALEKLKKDAGPGVKSEGIDNIEQIINRRLDEQQMEAERDRSPSIGGSSPRSTRQQLGQDELLANERTLDRLIEEDEQAKQSVHQAPRGLTDNQEKAIKHVTHLVRMGEHRNAVTLLRDLRRSVYAKAAPRHAAVEGLMAQVANIERRPQVALNLAGPFAERRDEYQPAKFNCYLQVSYANLALGAPDLALDLFNWVAFHENDGDLLKQILAVEGVGCTRLAQKSLPQAESAFGFALHNLKALVAQNEYSSYLDEDTLAFTGLLQKRLLEQLSKVRHQRFLERVGPIFVLYRDAQRLRIVNQDYVGALKKYGELIAAYPGSSYSDAARFWSGICKIELGAFQAGAEQLRKFVDENRFGLYRGEALLALGMLYLERAVDPESAEAVFAELNHWLSEVHDHPDPELVDILPGAMPEIQPPLSPVTADFWGRELPAIDPGHLVNRRTAEWYLPQLRLRADKVQVFLSIARGDLREAQATLVRVKALDDSIDRRDGKGKWTDIRRLAIAAENGYFVARPEELRLYSPRQRHAILLGDYYYVMGKNQRADAMFARLLGGEFGNLTARDRAYPEFARGLAKYRLALVERRGTVDEALAHFYAVLALRSATITEDRAALAIGNVARASADVAEVRKGWLVLNRLAESSGRNSFVYKARVRLGRDLVELGRSDEGMRMLRRVPAEAPEGTLAQWFIRFYEQRVGQ